MVSDATVEEMPDAAVEPGESEHSEQLQAGDGSGDAQQVTDVDGQTAGMTRLQREHYEKICQANMMVQSASEQYENAKSEASWCKKRLEQLQARLTNLIAEGPSRQQQLPYPEDGDRSDAGDDADGTAAADESWKETPISEAIDATEKQLEKLADAGVRTVGQFEALRAGQVDGYPDGLRSIKGVGQKTVDKWEDEILEWLQQHTWGQESNQEVDADDVDGDDD